MSRVVQLSPRDLQARRDEILHELGTSLDELRGRAEASGLIGSEWDAWRELSDIAFLLEDG